MISPKSDLQTSTSNEASPAVVTSERNGAQSIETQVPPAEPEKFVPINLDLLEKESRDDAKKEVRRAKKRGRWVIPDRSTEFGIEIGVAGDIATWMSGDKYYDIKNRGHFLGSVRWGKVMGTKAFVTYSWAVEFMPINIAIGNEVDNKKWVVGAPASEPPRVREATYGFGINPASFRFTFFPKLRLRPQVGTGFGIVRHFKRVPTAEGTKTNFQWDFQIGGQFMLKEDRALNFGYKYYHFSNVYLFNFNPGYNVNMFFVGYSIFKPRK